jgi:hypothetical protein
MASSDKQLKNRLILIRLGATLILALILEAAGIATGYIVAVILALLLLAVFFDKHLIKFARYKLK